LTDVHVDKPIEHESSANEAIEIKEAKWNKNSIKKFIALKDKLIRSQKGDKILLIYRAQCQ
jgi:hypothetical protein